MDARELRIQLATASSEERERILAQLQAEQADRDKQRAEREVRQDKRQVWQLVATVAAVAAVIASVVAIILSYASLKQQQDSAARQDEASRYSSMTERNLDLQKTIADNPILLCSFWAKVCDANPRLKQPKLKPQDELLARVFASYKLDTYGYLYSELESLGAAPDSGEFILRKNATQADKQKYEAWITWSETFVDAFQNSPVMCQALKDSFDAYEERFVYAIAANTCPGLEDLLKKREQSANEHLWPPSSARQGRVGQGLGEARQRRGVEGPRRGATCRTASRSGPNRGSGQKSLV
jgi:hypothetical protein